MATLHTSDLTKTYSGRTVVKGVNLDISSGEVVGLLGPNGAGKTTTFSMVVGLTAPDTGRVLLDGADVTDDPMYVRARKGIGYLPQEASIFRGLSVEDNIMAILETLPLDAAGRRTRRAELLAELGLTEPVVRTGMLARRDRDRAGRVRRQPRPDDGQQHEDREQAEAEPDLRGSGQRDHPTATGYPRGSGRRLCEPCCSQRRGGLRLARARACRGALADGSEHGAHGHCRPLWHLDVREDA